jgi:hypothetical protein
MPGLHHGEVSGSDDQYRLAHPEMEHGDRDRRAGVGQVAQVIRQLDIAAAFHCRPAAFGGRARRCHAPGVRCRLRNRSVLPLDPKLLTGPNTGNCGPALHRAVLLEAPATASKSAPATRTVRFHAALIRCSRPPGSVIGSAGWNQSPRSFRPGGLSQLPGRLHARRARQHPYGQVIMPGPLLQPCTECLFASERLPAAAPSLVRLPRANRLA